jgi:NADH dehydrogenase (ubiquinone) 1 beta subcomplex subunit 7
MTREEMRDAEVPLSERDWCAHHVVAANFCREANGWKPWRCRHEVHELETCRMDLYAIHI